MSDTVFPRLPQDYTPRPSGRARLGGRFWLTARPDSSVHYVPSLLTTATRRLTGSESRREFSEIGAKFPEGFGLSG